MYSINIGDQFARSIIYMGSVIWQKKTTMNTTGGANVMGSYPYPPNGMIEIDYYTMRAGYVAPEHLSGFMTLQ